MTDLPATEPPPKWLVRLSAASAGLLLAAGLLWLWALPGSSPGRAVVLALSSDAWQYCFG